MNKPELEYDWTPCRCVQCDPEAAQIGTTQAPQLQVSDVRTPWAIICWRHGQVFLTNHEYNRQMAMAGIRWLCPYCLGRDSNSTAHFDDANFSKANKAINDTTDA